MKNTFPEFQNKTHEKLNDMLENGIIIFDTNVLLNLYRYSTATREELKKVIEWCKDRVFMPYQIGYEFYKNRLIIIDDLVHQHEKIEKNIDKFLLECGNICRQNSDFYRIINDYTSKLKDKISQENQQREHFEDNDTIRIFLEKIYDGRVGKNFKEIDINNINKEAQERISKNIPPAYKDKSKDNGNQYGDFYIWKQMLNEAKKQKKDLIFITEDIKEDWWQIISGKKIGPRTELIKEFMDFNQGKEFHMYRISEFMPLIAKVMQKKIHHKALEEIKKIAENANSDDNHKLNGNDDKTAQKPIYSLKDVLEKIVQERYTKALAQALMEYDSHNSQKSCEKEK